MKKPILVLSIIACVFLNCKAKTSAEFEHNNVQCKENSCDEGYTCVNAHCFKSCIIQDDCPSSMLCVDQGYCVSRARTKNSTVTAEDDPNSFEVSYEVSPAKKEVFIENRKSISLQFVLNEIRGTQKSVVTDTIWKVEPKGEIVIEPDGWIYLDGSVAGNFTISAFRQGEIKGSAQLTIKTKEQTFAEGVSSDSASLFPSDNPLTSTTTQYSKAESIPLVYPHDAVVFPRNISSVMFQWNAVSGATLYRVIVGGSVSVISLLTHATEARFSKETWSVLANSERNVPIQWMIEAVSESQTSMLFSSAKRTMIFSDDRLQGAIYYWSVDTANIMRFRMGEDSAKPLFDKTGYPEIPQPTKENVKCAGCHTIGLDGKTMALTFEGGNYEGRKSGIIDVQKPYEPLVKPENDKFLSIYQSFSPDVKYLVLSLYDLSKTNIHDTVTGDLVKTLVDSPSAHPRWSSDGKTIAFAKVLDNKRLNYQNSEIHAIEVNGFDVISDQIIIPSDGSALSDIDISPDSKAMVYRKSTTNSIGDTNTHTMLYSFETKISIELFKLLDGTNNRDYWYSFSPFPNNDYYWIVFFSRRKYGNKTTDGVSQLWISAVDKNFSANSDPSHPSFWLNGQDPTTRNMKGQWVPDYCLTEREQCELTGTGKTCCEGLECKPEGMSDTADQTVVYSCQYPSPPCVEKGKPCQDGAEVCCNGFLCKITEGSMSAPLCVPPPPPCLEKNELCTLDGVSKCCEPYSCQAETMSDTDLYNIERKCL